MTKREELARVLWRQNLPMNLSKETQEALWRKDATLFLGEVDAILDALMEPSEEMLDAGIEQVGVYQSWQAMIRAIKEETN